MATKKRLTIEIPEAAEERLEKLKIRFGTQTTIEVIKRALSLADFLTEAADEGKTLVIKDRDGTQETIRLVY